MGVKKFGGTNFGSLQKLTFPTIIILLAFWAGGKKSRGSKFLHDIYLEYFVILGASWLRFGTDIAQPFQNFMAFVVFVSYACKCQKMAALKIESFPCNHSINVALSGFNSTRQRIQVKFKAKTVNL